MCLQHHALSQGPVVVHLLSSHWIKELLESTSVLLFHLEPNHSIKQNCKKGELHNSKEARYETRNK